MQGDPDFLSSKTAGVVYSVLGMLLIFATTRVLVVNRSMIDAVTMGFGSLSALVGIALVWLGVNIGFLSSSWKLSALVVLTIVLALAESVLLIFW